MLNVRLYLLYIVECVPHSSFSMLYVSVLEFGKDCSTHVSHHPKNDLDPVASFISQMSNTFSVFHISVSSDTMTAFIFFTSTQCTAIYSVIST